MSEFPELHVVDLDSPFVFGLGRQMTEEERAEARSHGRFDDPPMSVLSVDQDGLAAVRGKELAYLFATAPDMLAALKTLLAYWEEDNGVEGCACYDEWDAETNTEIPGPHCAGCVIRAAIAKATPTNQ